MLHSLTEIPPTVIPSVIAIILWFKVKSLEDESRRTAKRIDALYMKYIRGDEGDGI